MRSKISVGSGKGNMIKRCSGLISGPPPMVTVGANLASLCYCFFLPFLELAKSIRQLSLDRRGLRDV